MSAAGLPDVRLGGQALHRTVGRIVSGRAWLCWLGWIDILASKDLQPLPDAFDARASLLGRTWHGYAAVRIGQAEAYPRLRASGGDVDNSP